MLKQVLIQQQQQVHLATLQQMQLSHLLEQSSENVEEEIQKALEENPALERMETDYADNGAGAYGYADTAGGYGGSNSGGYAYPASGYGDTAGGFGESATGYGDAAGQTYFDERQERGPVGRGGEGSNSYENWIGDLEDEGDSLQQQIDDLNLSASERQVMNYIASGLNENGYLTKDDETLADELAFEAYMDVSAEEVHRLVELFQSLEPAGIAAHTPQECLSLQLRRKRDGLKASDAHRRQVLTNTIEVVEGYLEHFARGDWDAIEEALALTETDITAVRQEILQCDPAPGLHIGAAQKPAARAVTPDFYLSVNDRGHIHIELSRAHNPRLRISHSYQEVVDRYARLKHPTRAQKEEYTVAREMVTRAHSYIDNLMRRQETLRRTMQEIARRQRDFFLNQDDPMMLQPLKLQHVAEAAEVSISTISRAAKSKYVETYYGLYPLRYFFNAQTMRCHGKPVSSAVVKVVLSELIEAEDPTAPKSDMQLTRQLNAMGYEISRRTVAKYRKRMSIDPIDLRRRRKS